MIGSRLLHRKFSRMRMLACFLALTMLVEVPAAAAGLPAQRARLEKIRVQSSGNFVYIYYNLIGDPDAPYDVKVVMKKVSNPDFEYSPADVSGDVGRNVYSGEDRRIVWDISREYPHGLAGNDLYFVISAEEVSQGGIRPMVLVAGGVVLAGGIVALLLLAGKGGQGASPEAAGFPPPPGRP